MSKIFIGLINVASQFNDLKKGFKHYGVDTFTVNMQLPHIIVTDNSDFNIEKVQKRIPKFKPHFISIRLKSWWNKRVKNYVYDKALKECETFIFLWKTFENDFSDIKKLKESGKKVINVFVGDDARWYYSMKQEFEHFGLKPLEYDENYNYSIAALNYHLSFIRTAEKYSDFIFSRLDQAQLQMRPYYRWNMMVCASDFKNKPEQRKNRPVVVHAPSHRGLKGTKYVLEAFEKLKSEGIDFETVLIENLPNEKAIEIYSNADIVIDQLICPGTGKLATEALACGKIVMGHMAYDSYPQKNPEGCPIIDVNPENLYEKLKEIILDFEFRKKHALSGRPYVEKYLDVNIFCKKVLDLLNGEQIPYDYAPTFFREHFIPESEKSVPVYNKWTELIKDCNWYKQTVKPGERAGLKF